MNFNRNNKKFVVGIGTREIEGERKGEKVTERVYITKLSRYFILLTREEKLLGKFVDLICSLFLNYDGMV